MFGTQQNPVPLKKINLMLAVPKTRREGVTFTTAKAMLCIFFLCEAEIEDSFQNLGLLRLEIMHVSEVDAKFKNWIHIQLLKGTCRNMWGVKLVWACFEGSSDTQTQRHVGEDGLGRPRKLQPLPFHPLPVEGPCSGFPLSSDLWMCKLYGWTPEISYTFRLISALSLPYVWNKSMYFSEFC